MSDETLQSMTASLTRIDSCLSDLIAERDRLKAENAELRALVCLAIPCHPSEIDARLETARRVGSSAERIAR